MAHDRIYLTVDKEKRRPEDDGYVAVISRGHPRAGDKSILVLACTTVPNMKAAKAWYRRMKAEQPWETRQ